MGQLLVCDEAVLRFCKRLEVDNVRIIDCQVDVGLAIRHPLVDEATLDRLGENLVEHLLAQDLLAVQLVGGHSHDREATRPCNGGRMRPRQRLLPVVVILAENDVESCVPIGLA